MRSIARLLLGLLAGVSAGLGAENEVAPLPPGVQVVWDVSQAHREVTPTRERICLNGLWQWQPTETTSQEPPTRSWGWFKVPGCWPGITDYMQKDCQTVIAHPAWQGQGLGKVSAAWHQREIAVPAEWAGRRIALRLEYLNSFAVVYLDGHRAGEIQFPGGELDVTAQCQPGRAHTLSLLVIALPLKGVMLAYTDSASAREMKGSVARRGLCGDVYLLSTPRGPRLGDARASASVRQRETTFEAGIEGLAADQAYRLRARIAKADAVIKESTSPAFRAGDLREGRLSFSDPWLADQLWDTHTPQNQYRLEVSLMDGAGRVLDTAWPERCGFREIWIDGRDFYLNGTRLFLSAVPLDNAQISAGLATYDAARESLQRLQSFGINFVYTHNYGCEPGSYLGFEEILRAADDVGMLVALSQPHFSHYDWPSTAADGTNGYARHAEYFVRAAQNHPSVVMYSMSHNATGYNEDMNPDLIDGLNDPRDRWSANNAKLAVRAEAIVNRLDPHRIVYHHASGNLGSMHPMNFYPNFVPVQELSDWFGHWASAGVKPAFLCEYGAPFTWDWTMYRGWYNGKREFGSAAVPWEFCLAEWNAQFLGDRAFQLSEAEKANLRWEAKQYRAGKLWHRWDYPNQVGSTRFEERYPVFARYLTDNWRAFRTWGVSAISPWEHGHFWKLREGVDQRRKELKVDWEHLQRPGFSPDYIDQRYERVDLAYESSDWIGTPAAESLYRNNRPLLGWLAGKPASFTSKDHNFLPGESVEKQLIVINNSRETVACDCEWTLNLPQPLKGVRRVTVAAGQQERIPVRCELPVTLAPGKLDLTAGFKFSTGETQTDGFSLTILEAAKARQDVGLDALAGKIALFDPKGETRTLLDGMGVRCQSVDANTDLSPYDILLVGKFALTPKGAVPDLSRVREGLRVVVFEQTSEVLEQRLGFRVEEYGLREVFPRIAGHPLLAGLGTEHLRDWRGEATTLPPRLKYELNPKFNGAPTVTWCGLPVTRLWRCGNRGNVASVLIEKPVRGDFLPILDGGFSLQYSPLMEYREGRGMVLFCQMDVTGRTEQDPAAATLARNLMRYAATWAPAPRRTVVYAGESAGRRHLESIGIAAAVYEGGSLLPDQTLILGPGAGQALAGRAAPVAEHLKRGGCLLAIGMDQQEAQALLPFPVTMRRAEHIATFFEPFPPSSLLAGVGPADTHNRDPRGLSLLSGGAMVAGDGVLGRSSDANLLFCQIVPWQFAEPKQANLKRTHRRASFVVTRLLANLGVAGATPLLERFHQPVEASKPEQRWLTGLYLDQPEEWDDPYRFFRW